MREWAVVLCFVFSLVASGSIRPISREVTRNYVADGTFEGGSPVAADIANIRVGAEGSRGFERWVVDFGDPERGTIGQVAPRFSVRYSRGQEGFAKDGSSATFQPPRLILDFQNIRENRVPVSTLEAAIAKSAYVANVVVYPPVENGDRVIELILKGPILFEAHQPARREGRLVVDLRSPPE